MIACPNLALVATHLAVCRLLSTATENILISVLDQPLLYSVVKKKAGHVDHPVDMPRLMGGLCEGSVPTAEGAIDHIVEIGVVPRLGVVAHP